MMIENVESCGALTLEQLETLGEEIAAFAARVDVATHALLTRLRTFDEHEAWGPAGFLSCAQWLSWRTGIGLTAAREKVRVARALGTLEKVDARFGRGELSYSKVRAITRVATPQTEQDFIDVAMHATASQVERLFRGYKRCRDQAEVAVRELPRDQRRFVRRAETPGGMVRIELQLPPEEAALVWSAMLSAAERPCSASPATAGASAEANASTAAQPPSFAPANDGVEVEQRRADAIVDVARAYLQHRPPSFGSGYELVVVTSRAQLEHGPGGVGGFLRDGTPVPLGIARQLASDGGRIDVIVGERGEVLDVGRRTRSIPTKISRALALRDGGCRVPGCGHKRHLHAHHIQGWAAGGPTSVDNLVLVCSAHHRRIHEGSLRAEIRAERIEFIDRSGRHIPAVPRSAASGRDLEELERFLREVDLHVDPSINAPRWDGVPMDLADSLAWLLMAEATQ